MIGVVVLVLFIVFALVSSFVWFAHSVGCLLELMFITALERREKLAKLRAARSRSQRRSSPN